jgi:branched-chain amino acid transport system substrate-binding protein
MKEKMRLRRRALLAGTAASMIGARQPRAASQVIRIGVLSDLGGPYRDNGGLTSVACARQAVEDLGLATRGIHVEIISADHQNKADVGLNVAREWFDRGDVDAVAEINNSSIALAINDLVKEKNKVSLCTGAGSIDLTGPRCSPNMVQWQTDTWSDARIGEAVMKVGGDKWFFIVADYVTGHLLYENTSQVVTAAGGSVVGTAKYPFSDTTGFSSFLIEAQARGANVVAFCNAGADLVNCIKQSHEFGMKDMKLVGIVTFSNVIRTLGLETAQDLLLSESFYWDLNDRTRRFMNRIKPKVPNNWPNSEQACAYGGVLHYLKAVAELGVPRAKASGFDVVTVMKRMPTDDDCFGPASIRADGRKLHPLNIFQVKKPSESSGEWDIYKLVDTIPAERAFRPLVQGGCKFAIEAAARQSG